MTIQQAPPVLPPRSAEAPRPRPGRGVWLALLAVIGVAVLLVGLLVWAPWTSDTPGTPRAVTAHSSTGAGVTLTWHAGSGPSAKQYVVQRDGAQIAEVPGTQTTYLDTGLMPGTTHRYSVTAVRGSHESAPSATVTETTLLPVPTRLTAEQVTNDSVTLHWLPPPNAPQPDSYVVLRDNVTLATLPGDVQTYRDATVTRAHSYAYQVGATWADQRSSLSYLSVTTPVPGPTGLKVDAVTMTSVTFHWKVSGFGAGSWDIVRDGVTVDTVTTSEWRYRATGLSPGTTYRFQVAGVFANTRSELSAPLVVKTLAPSPATARFEGHWTVHLEVTATGGGSVGVGDTWTDEWIVTPRCTSGACAATLHGGIAPAGFVYHAFTMTLQRSGAVYTGSTKAHITHCGTKPIQVDVNNTVTVRMTVTKAAFDPDHAWMATAWRGTVAIAAPYTTAGLYACPAQTVVATISASS